MRLRTLWPCVAATLVTIATAQSLVGPTCKSNAAAAVANGLDCGPYTPTYCQSCPTSCKKKKKTRRQTGGGIDNGTEEVEEAEYAFNIDVMPDPPAGKSWNLSQETFAAFKVLEAAYAVEFGLNEMFDNPPANLPLCTGAFSQQTKRSMLELGSSDDDDYGPYHKAIDLLSRRGSYGFGGVKTNFPPTYGSDREPRPYIRPPTCIPQNITIKVHFHIYTTNTTTARRVTNTVLNDQIKAANKAYAPMQINFVRGQTRNRTGAAYNAFTHATADADTPDRLKIQRDDHIGGFDEVNIYIVESIDKPVCSGSTYSRTTGYCHFPADTYNDRKRDGCFLDIDSLPGVSFRGGGPGDGSTFVHEVGHWFGLKHNFAQRGDGATVSCQATAHDGISDTPFWPGPGQFQPQQYECCGTPKNFKYCKDQVPVNLLPVTNYMSYSKAAGDTSPKQARLKPWTRGQRAHIYATFFTIRRDVTPPYSGVTCNENPVYYPKGMPKRAYDPELEKRQDTIMTGETLLDQPPNYISSLDTLCSVPDPNNELELDAVTGVLKKAGAVVDNPSSCSGTSCLSSTPTRVIPGTGGTPTPPILSPTPVIPGTGGTPSPKIQSVSPGTPDAPTPIVIPIIPCSSNWGTITTTNSQGASVTYNAPFTTTTVGGQVITVAYIPGSTGVVVLNSRTTVMAAGTGAVSVSTSAGSGVHVFVDRGTWVLKVAAAAVVGVLGVMIML